VGYKQYQYKATLKWLGDVEPRVVYRVNAASLGEAAAKVQALAKWGFVHNRVRGWLIELAPDGKARNWAVPPLMLPVGGRGTRGTVTSNTGQSRASETPILASRDLLDAYDQVLKDLED